MVTSYIACRRIRACRSGLISIGIFLMFLTANISSTAVPVFSSGPHVTITSRTATAFEDGFAEGIFIVERKGPTSEPVTVRLLVQGSATNGTDYQTIPQEIQIPAGTSTAEVRVTPLNDTDPEDDEVVTVALADAPHNSTANKTLANVVIKDNDTVVQISAVDPIGAEAGRRPIVYRFTRTGNLTSQLTVRFSINPTNVRTIPDGNSNTIQLGDGAVRTTFAAQGVDFLTPPLSVTFRSGEAEVQLTVTPIDDSAPEVCEQVVVSISPDHVYEIGFNRLAAGFIEDNDTDAVPNNPAAIVIAPQHRRFSD